MKRSSTTSGRRVFGGHAVGRRGIRSLGVIIMGGGVRLVLAIFAGSEFVLRWRIPSIKNVLLIGVCERQDGQANL
jgi:hypothetical protein